MKAGRHIMMAIKIQIHHEDRGVLSYMDNDVSLWKNDVHIVKFVSIMHNSIYCDMMYP